VSGEYLLRIAREWRLADEHLVRHHAERVDVGAVVGGWIGRRLLRRHVGRCAQRDAGAGQVRRRGGVAHRFGDTEVRNQGVAARQEDVLRLDVAMDDAVLV
jgi:hypothetical protein